MPERAESTESTGGGVDDCQPATRARRVVVIRGPGGLPALDLHAGSGLAMEEFGLHPDVVTGCSAGAVYGALEAAGMPYSRITTLLRSYETRDLIAKRSLWRLRMGTRGHICDPAPIRRTLQALLPERFEDLEIPLCIQATAMDSPSRPVIFRAGAQLPERVMASMSIPGVFPPTRIHNIDYTDGYTTCRLPVPPEVLTGPGYIWLVIHPVRVEDYARRSESPISQLLWAYERAARSAADLELADMRSRYPARVLEIKLPIPTGQSSLKFDHGLIDAAYLQTRQVLGLYAERGELAAPTQEHTP